MEGGGLCPKLDLKANTGFKRDIVHLIYDIKHVMTKEEVDGLHVPCDPCPAPCSCASLWENRKNNAKPFCVATRIDRLLPTTQRRSLPAADAPAAFAS
eukprot:1157770-Pelagomonas_calceolata.AAC.3